MKAKERFVERIYHHYIPFKRERERMRERKRERKYESERKTERKRESESNRKMERSRESERRCVREREYMNISKRIYRHYNPFNNLDFSNIFFQSYSYQINQS